MFDDITQNFVNLMGNLHKGDLNRTFSLDANGIKLEPRTGQKLTFNVNFYRNDQATELGIQNQATRMILLTALSNIVTGGVGGMRVAMNDVQRQAIASIQAKLLGTENGADKPFLPISARDVKQLLTEAQQARAQSAVAALPNGDQTVADMEQAIAQMRDTAKLNGMESRVDKMVGKLFASLEKAGGKINAATDERDRNLLIAKIEQTVRAFYRDAQKLQAKMPGPDTAIDSAIAKYERKNKTTLGTVFCAQFRNKARALAGNFTDFKAYGEKVAAILPQAIQEANEASNPPDAADANSNHWFRSVCTDFQAFQASVSKMTEERSSSNRLVQQGRNLTATPKFAFGPEAFDMRGFLKGQPTATETPLQRNTAFTESLKSRNGSAAFRFRCKGGAYAPDNGSNAFATAMRIDNLCGKNVVQSAAVKAAIMNVRIDAFVNAIMARAGITDGMKAAANVYSLAKDAEGNVLLTVSTRDSDPVEASLTLKIAPDGTRTVDSFSGVRTSDAYADKLEQDARRAGFKAMLPSLKTAKDVALLAINTKADDAKNAQAGGLKDVKDAAKTAADNLYNALETLANGTDRLERSPAQYEAELNTQLENLKTRCANRVDSNVRLTGKVGAQRAAVLETLTAAALKLRQAGHKALSGAVQAHIDKFAKYADKLLSDFCLSGEYGVKAEEEIAAALKQYGERLADAAARLADKPTLDEGIAFCTTLTNTGFPQPAFNEFSEEAKGKILSARTLTNAEAVANAAIAHPGNGGVAEAVAQFAESANRLLALAQDWEDGPKKTEFIQKVQNAVEKISTTVADGINAGTDFSKGIGGILNTAYAPLAEAFKEGERQHVNDLINEKGGQFPGKLAKLLDAKNPLILPGGKPFVPTAVQRKDIEKAQNDVRNLLLDVLSRNNGESPLTRASVEALFFKAEATVSKFIADITTPQALVKEAKEQIGKFSFASLASKKFYSGIANLGKAVAQSKGVASVAFRLPVNLDGDLAFNTSDAVNPFAGQAGQGFASFDDLVNHIRAQTALGATLNPANPALRDMARDIFYEMEEARGLLAIDDDNNVTGYKEINGEKPGEQIVQTALKTAVAAQIETCVQALAQAQPGAAVDTDRFIGPAGMEALRHAIAAALQQEIARYNEVAQAEAQPVQDLRPGEVLKRGNDVLGLDIEYIREQGKLDSLKHVLLGMMNSDARHRYYNLLANDPEGAETLMTSWLHQPVPMLDNNPAFLIGGNSIEKLGKAFLTGTLPLDGTLNDETIDLVRYLTMNGATGVVDPNETSPVGFRSDDPGENYQLLVRNGLTPTVIAQIFNAPAAEPGDDAVAYGDALNARDNAIDSRARSVVGTIGTLFHANRDNPSGLDMLYMRIIGQPISAPWPESANNLVPYGQRVLVHNGYGQELLDPLTRLSGKTLDGALFFMRQAVPTTNYVPETLNILDKLKELAATPGAAQRDITYAGVRFTLAKDANGGIVATQHAHGSFIEFSLSPDSAREREMDKDIAFKCPLDISSFIRQIEDEISSNVSAYGRNAAAGILPAANAPAADTSRARQLGLNVIASLTGTLSTELSHIATQDVVAIARGLLATRTDPKQHLANALARLQGDGVDRFNGAATLELYRQMQSAPQEDVAQKVTLPQESRIREGETLAQSRVRRVHEFISELVMPEDTTRYDLDRDAGLDDAGIMRKTILSHKYELGLILRYLGTNADLLDSFSLATGAEQNGAVPRILELSATLKARMLQLKSLIDARGGIDAFFQSLEAGGADAEVETILRDFSADLSSASDKILAKMQGVLTEKLSAAFRSSTAASKGKELWKKTLDEIAGSGTLDTDTGYGQMLMEVLSTYFSRMAPIDRHRMASSLVRSANAESSVGAVLGALIKGAGPVLQKLMQGLPQTALPEDLRTAVTDLKSRLPDISPEMARATLYDMVKNSNGRITNITLTRSLGAATVGQAFLCRIFTVDNPAGEECVIKILRPDAQSRARRERTLFLEIAARTPGMKDAFKVRLDGIFQELDFTTESNNIKKGAIYNSGIVKDGIKNVKSMELYPFIGATANTLVLRKAEGDTYDRAIDKTKEAVKQVLDRFDKVVNPDGTVIYKSGDIDKITEARRTLLEAYNATHRRQKALLGFMEKWTYEAIFGKGFFHGDVHAGNLMCGVKDLTVIDYGNAATFSDKDRENLKWGLAWMAAGNAGEFLSYYANLISPEGKAGLEKNRAKLAAALQEVFERNSSGDRGRLMAATFQLIQQMDVELPGPIFSLMQSMQRLDETARLLNEQMENIRTALDAMRLTPELQPKDGVLPAFLQPLSEIQSSSLRLPYVGHPEPDAVSQVFTSAVHYLEQGQQDYLEGNRFNHLFAEYVNKRFFYLNEPKDPNNPRYQDHLEKLVTDAADSPDQNVREQAAQDLFRELDEMRAYLKRKLATGSSTTRISASGIIAVLDICPGNITKENRDQWMQTAVNISKSFGNLLKNIHKEFLDTLPTDVENEDEDEDANGTQELPFCPEFDDATEGFSNAIGRGTSEFAGQQGLGVVFRSPLKLKNSIKALVIEGKSAEHRLESIKTTYRTFLHDNGIYTLENMIVGRAMRDYRYKPELRTALLKTGWANSEATRRAFAETLRFNIDNVMSALSNGGFADRVQDAQKRKAFISLAMQKVVDTHPELYKALTDADQATIDLVAGNDVDVKNALTFLKGIADDPPNEELTDEERREIDEEFSIF